MRALWLDKKLSWRDDIPTPNPTEGEALIRVTLAGICNTDLELEKGYRDFSGIPGHEFVGVVERAPGQPAWEGRRVVGEINIACGHCAQCQALRPQLCEQRRALGISGHPGALADYLTLPLKNLHALPKTLTDEEAVFTEPLAAACQLLEQIHVRPSERVAVVGDGKLGLLCAQVLALSGCELTMIGHHAQNLQLLAGLGISTTMNAASLTPASIDIVVEASGGASGYNAALRLVRPGGKLLLKSTYQQSFNINLSAAVVNEITMIGSRCGPFPAALRLLERNLVHVRPMIQARYPFSDALQAFAHARRKGTLKVLLEM